MSNKIFIIEPDYNLASGLSAKLSINGFLTSVNNGQNAVKDLINSIITFQPEFLIIELGFINGFDVLKKLQFDPFLNKIPVIIYTDLDEDGLKEKLEPLGIRYLYTKATIGLDDFVDKVAKIIKNRDKVSNPIKI